MAEIKTNENEKTERPNKAESSTNFSNINPKTEISVRQLLKQLESQKPHLSWTSARLKN